MLRRSESRASRSNAPSLAYYQAQHFFSLVAVLAWAPMGFPRDSIIHGLITATGPHGDGDRHGPSWQARRKSECGNSMTTVRCLIILASNLVFLRDFGIALKRLTLGVGLVFAVRCPRVIDAAIVSPNSHCDLTVKLTLYVAKQGADKTLALYTHSSCALCPSLSPGISPLTRSIATPGSCSGNIC